MSLASQEMRNEAGVARNA